MSAAGAVPMERVKGGRSSIGEFDQVVAHGHLQSLRKRELIANFPATAICDFDEAQMLPLGLASASFDDIARDGNDCTSHLSRESEPFFRRPLFGLPVNPQHEFVSNLEGVETAIVFHGADSTRSSAALAAPAALAALKRTPP